jgi:hypothetical protein
LMMTVLSPKTSYSSCVMNTVLLFFSAL